MGDLIHVAVFGDIGFAGEHLRTELGSDGITVDGSG